MLIPFTYIITFHSMDYLSLFSGIGGLESPNFPPRLLCEIDTACHHVLRKRFPNVEIVSDVMDLEPPQADVVSGGWPCQDISVAGLRRGLKGARSGLFFRMVEIAQQAHAHTIVAENVPNLLSLEGGKAFDLLLANLEQAGFPFIAWRTLNVRQFGVPHERRRVFIVASKHREIASALHRPVINGPIEEGSGQLAAGFYWTAGSQSICYSKGYVPTLKVGSSISIPSPPAVHYGDIVRKCTPQEALRLQGFDPVDFTDVQAKDIYRMAGNAVAIPAGHFVMNCLLQPAHEVLHFDTFGFTSESGFYEHGLKKGLSRGAHELANNLADFIDLQNQTRLSQRAASGLLRRLNRSGKDCPPDLLSLLTELSNTSERSSTEELEIEFVS